MLKNGIYKHEHLHEYVEETLYEGDILLEVKETETQYVLRLISNSVKYDAPQIDDMFLNTNPVKIRKAGSKHALCDWGDNSFTLYPYRVGVPYVFRLEE